MQRKVVFMDKQGKKQQSTGKGHQRDMNKVTNLFKKAGERVIPFYCMSLLEAHLFGSECFSPPSESRMTSLTTVPRSRALISSGSAMS